MSFRTVVIDNRCKLEYSLNYMVCRKGLEIKRILVSEIKTLVINSLQVSITTTLISELIKNKVKIIFIDETHNPSGEIIPYQNNYYSYRKIKEQINFSTERKDYLWKHIVIAKIVNQAINLSKVNKKVEYNKLLEYATQVENKDLTNREGHAAKVYFYGLFGHDFKRDDRDNNINKYLNYGYSIILSAINREIKVLGYLTELGIHHIGESNSFNLSCDFIEPLRPFVDSYIIQKKVNESNYKKELINMLYDKVIYNGKEFFLDNAIKLYVEDMMNYLATGDEMKIRFIEYGV